MLPLKHKIGITQTMLKTVKYGSLSVCLLIALLTMLMQLLIYPLIAQS